MRHIGAHSGKVMYFGSICFRGELGFMNCDDICMCIIRLSFSSLFLIPFMLACSIIRFISILLRGLCAVRSYVVVFGLSVRLSWYPVW